jgi:hypothetical protein
MGDLLCRNQARLGALLSLHLPTPRPASTAKKTKTEKGSRFAKQFALLYFGVLPIRLVAELATHLVIVTPLSIFTSVAVAPTAMGIAPDR